MGALKNAWKTPGKRLEHQARFKLAPLCLYPGWGPAHCAEWATLELETECVNGGGRSA